MLFNKEIVTVWKKIIYLSQPSIFERCVSSAMNAFFENRNTFENIYVTKCIKCKISSTITENYNNSKQKLVMQGGLCLTTQCHLI